MSTEFTKLHQAAFALETVAHMQGMERMLLPHAEFVRRVDEAMKSWAKAQTAHEVFQARHEIGVLVEVNGNE